VTGSTTGTRATTTTTPTSPEPVPGAKGASKPRSTVGGKTIPVVRLPGEAEPEAQVLSDPGSATSSRCSSTRAPPDAAHDSPPSDWSQEATPRRPPAPLSSCCSPRRAATASSSPAPARVAARITVVRPGTAGRRRASDVQLARDQINLDEGALADGRQPRPPCRSARRPSAAEGPPTSSIGSPSTATIRSSGRRPAAGGRGCPGPRPRPRSRNRGPTCDANTRRKPGESRRRSRCRRGGPCPP